MEIEILYFEGCPNHEPTALLLNETLKELGINAEIVMTDVKNNDDAIEKKFIGSPSIRINGRDLELDEKDEYVHYSMQCRMYSYGDRHSGIPPKELLKHRLTEEVG